MQPYGAYGFNKQTSEHTARYLKGRCKDFVDTGRETNGSLAGL